MENKKRQISKWFVAGSLLAILLAMLVLWLVEVFAATTAVIGI